MFLCKTISGNYSPYDDSDREESNKVKAGDVIKATRARNPMFHKKLFALLKLGYDNQDRYDNFEVYRKVVTIKAGYYDEIADKHGQPYYLPRSLAYENMSAKDFDEFYQAALKVISEDLKTAPEEIQNQLNEYYG